MNNENKDIEQQTIENQNENVDTQVNKDIEQEEVKNQNDNEVKDTESINNIIAKEVEKALEKERKQHKTETNKIILESILRENKIPETYIEKFKFNDVDNKETLTKKVEDYITEITEISQILNLNNHKNVVIPDTGIDTTKKKRTTSFMEDFLNL